LPFYLLVRANAAWTPHPRFFPDDAIYARMCFPHGFLVYWNDFGFYRLLAVPAYAVSNRVVMRASLSPVPYTLLAAAVATIVFVWSCVAAGLSRRRGVLLAAVLLSSPLLVETFNFWSGTFNYALVLLLVAAQLRASRWAHQSGLSSRGYTVTACGALLALLTYEIALPFILATNALYARGWVRRLVAVCLATIAAVAVVAALAAAGLYWPQRFKLATEQLTRALSGTTTDANTTSPPNVTPEVSPTPEGHATGKVDTTPEVNATANVSAPDVNALRDVNASGDVNATGRTGLVADTGQPASAAQPASATQPASAAPRAAAMTERAGMYVSLLFSFIATGLRRSSWFWAIAVALAALSFLSRPAGEIGREGRLPENMMGLAFGFALVACVGYLALTNSMNARYVAFLLIYGAATLAWMKARVAGYALAALLLVQAVVAASLPIHMRDVELAARSAAEVSSVTGATGATGTTVETTAATRAGDLVSTDGRLARASWGKRFHAPPAADLLAQPLNARACRYSVPCEECP